MKLPIPFLYNDMIIEGVELQEPSGETVANTKDEATKNSYRGIMEWIVGGVKEFITDTGGTIDKDIRNIVKKMPVKDAEVLAIYIALEIDSDDGIEGIYECPRCHVEMVCEFREGDDTRDHIIKDMAIEYQQGAEGITIDIDRPVILTQKSKINGAEAIIEIRKLEFRNPTLEDAVKAWARYGADQSRAQYALYVEALEKTNSETPSQADKANFGMRIFEKMAASDLRTLAGKMSRYGMRNTIRKKCKCGKEFDAEVNTANFFVSSLH